MHTFFHLQKADLHEIVKFQVDRRDGIHSQNNRFVTSLYDFQFTELYYDDAIGPIAESILQYALCVKQADENEGRNRNPRRVPPY